jgi:tetratricopeptide (TPR) repeat protein
MVRTGRRAEALPEAQAAVAAAEQAGDADALTAAHTIHVAALTYGGQLARAREALREAERLADAATPRTRAFLSDMRAQLAGAFGDLGERREAYEAAVALYLEAGDIRRAAGAEANLADVYNRVGAFEQAEAALRQAIEGGRRVNNRVTQGYALLNLGYALLMEGKAQEAQGALQDALSIAGTTRDVRLGVAARMYVSMCRLKAASPVEVAQEAEKLAIEAEAVGEPGIAVMSHTVAASARLAVGDHEGALSVSTGAMARLDELGGIEEGEAELFVIHARALEAAGRHREARSVIARGRARIAQIADRISDPEWRRRFLEDVPAHRLLMA